MTSAPHAFFISFGISFLLTPLLRRLARSKNWLDVPTTRSSHTTPTPRSGGKAIVLALALSTLIAGPVDAEVGWWLGAGVVVAIMGLVDDIRGMRHHTKFLMQGVAVAIVLMSGTTIRQLEFPGWTITFGTVTAVLLTFLWATGLTNAFNFMDGINGIAALSAVVAGFSLAVLCHRAHDSPGMVIALALSGAAAGFLPWNFPSGSIFMGDTGSATLGFMIAVMVCRVGSGPGSFIGAALPMTPFIADAAVTFCHRLNRGEAVFQAHRSHFYQRLVSLGWSHASVTLLWTILALVSAAAGLTYDLTQRGLQVTLLLIVAALHGAVFLAITFKERRRA